MSDPYQNSVTMNTSDVESGRPLAAQIALTASLSILMSAAVIGNLMVFLAISRATYLRTQVASVFIANLAISDLGCSVLVMPFSLVSVWQTQWVFSSFWCDAVCFLNYCFIIASMLTLALISVDRHVYVIYPLRYDVLMTPGLAGALVLSTWLVAFAFAVPPSGLGWVWYDDNEIICAIDWETDGKGSVIAYTASAFVICFLAPIVVMVYSYWGVFKVARRHATRVIPTVSVRSCSSSSVRRDFREQSATGGADAGPSGEGSSSKQVSLAEVRSVSRKNSLVSSSGIGRGGKSYASKAIKPILTMVIIYLICNTPFSLTKLIKVVMADNQAVPSYVSAIASWMAFLNPVCNPVIYSIMREDFQTAFWGILPEFCRRARRRGPGNAWDHEPSLRASGHAVAISRT